MDAVIEILEGLAGITGNFCSGDYPESNDSDIAIIELAGIDGETYHFVYDEEWDYWKDYFGEQSEHLENWSWCIYKIVNGEPVPIHENISPVMFVYYFGVYGGLNPKIINTVNYFDAILL